MRELSIGFSESKKFLPLFCWAIKAFEGTEFSHVYVRQNTHYNIDLIYQASGTTVNFMNDKVFLNKNKVVKEFKFNVTDQAYDNYMKFALTNVGKPYSVSQVIGIVIAKFLALRKNPFATGQASYVCSELIADVLYELAKFKIEREDFDSITPKEIFDLCLKLEAA